MTPLEDLEMIANDTDELMRAEHHDKGMQRALMSIVYRIRRVANSLSPDLKVHQQPTVSD